MAENVEWLHFAQVIILSSPVHLSNLVSLDKQAQGRRATTDFTFTLTPLSGSYQSETEYREQFQMIWGSA